MARKRSPETFEKRRRALEKQRKRAEKLADRVARNAAKRDGTYQDPSEGPEGPEDPEGPEGPEGGADDRREKEGPDEG